MMAKAMIMIVKKKELDARESFEGVRQKDITTWYLTDSLTSINTMDQFHDMNKVLRAVINKLIKDERTFIIVKDHEDPNERILRIHPNHTLE